MLNSSYLKELMMEHGMSLGQLSVRTGISKSQLSRILSGWIFLCGRAACPV